MGNHSRRQQSSSPKAIFETKGLKNDNLVSNKVNNRDILLLFRQK